MPIFSGRITADTELVTSWTKRAPQTFTFTIENRVVNGNANEEFLYTIAVHDELVYGKLGTDNTNSVGVPNRRWGSVTTPLKNGERYTVLVTVSYITNWGGAYAVRIDVIDRNGDVIKTGDVIYCNKNTYLNFVSDYKYSLTVTQESHTGYETTVGMPVISENLDNDNDRPAISDSARSFTFESRFGTRDGFTPEKNGYTGGEANSATVVFTNTGAAYIAPTGYRSDVLPFALMLALGLALLPVLRRRRRREDET